MGTTKLKLPEIAAVYGKTPRAFRRLVVRDGIPHETLGRDMYFDPAKVEAHLASAAPKNNVVKFTPKKRRKVNSDFAKAVSV